MKGCIVERKSARTGLVSYQLKYDTGKDLVTGRRSTCYKTLRGVTKKEAQKELRRLLHQIDSGTHVNPKNISLKEWAEKWLEFIKPTVAAKTFERYRELIFLKVIPTLGDVPIQKLNGVQIESLYSRLRSEGRFVGRVKGEDGEQIKAGLSEQTILHVHRAFSLCLKEAVRKRLLYRNPIQDVRSPRPKASLVSKTAEDNCGERIRALSAEQVVALLEGFRGHDLFPIVALAAGTGMRRGELLALQWCDVDFQTNSITVSRSVEDTNSLGVRLKATKNKASRRRLGLDKGLMELLRQRKQMQSEQCLSLGTKYPDNGLLFPNSILEPYLPLAPRNVTKLFVKKARQSGYRDISLHDLRHTHATLLLTSGVPINTVAQRLGHSSPVITLTTYGHVMKRSEDQVLSIVQDLLAKAL